MTPQIAIEPWETARAEFIRLCPRHWKEIAGNQDQIPLDPDWEIYDTMSKVGRMVFLSVRTPELIGYMIVFVKPHLHYRSTLHAYEDIYYLAPEWRRGLTGYRMFKLMLDTLRARGVVKAFFTHKLWFSGGRVGKLLERLGFTASETVYIKMLQE